MRAYVGIGFEAVVYTCFLIGIILIYGKEFDWVIQSIRMRRRLAVRAKKMDGAGKMREHLNYISSVSFDMKKDRLLFLILIIGAGSFVVGNMSFDINTALMFAMFLASTPYAVVRINFENLRKKTSFEGEALIVNFLNAYRISNFNVYEGLEGIIADGAQELKSKNLILKMILELRQSGSPQKIRQIINDFGNTVGTNWSRMFAYNVQLAAEKGIDVSLAVEDILLQLRDARKIYEERRRLNSEAMRIVVYLIPLLYMFTIVASVVFIGIEPEKLFRNQFFTKQGFSLFNVSALMFVMNLLVMECISKQKFDY
ncbi:MAG: hypothetical protein ACTTH0_03320 [Eubacteriales bacterium]